MSLLILLRHGQSTWNASNRFTGWVDVPLSDLGREEARQAGRRLAAEGLSVELAYTSTLRRAIDTGRIVLDELGQRDLDQIQAWQLNERFYGALTGQDKDEARAAFGDEQVHVWRRAFDAPVPGGENLKETAARVLPYFRDEIVPTTRSHDVVLVTAHGNSLRAVCKDLEGIEDEDIPGLEIPTGIPWVYEMRDGRSAGKRILE